MRSSFLPLRKPYRHAPSDSRYRAAVELFIVSEICRRAACKEKHVMKSVVITGTSTGIGWSAAKTLLDNGFRVFGSVRTAEDADRLRNVFGVNFVPLIFDVTDEAAVLAAAGEVRAALGGATLAGLVNNAGIATAGPSLELPLGDYRRHFEVNVMGPLNVTRAFVPLLGTDEGLTGAPGRVVMISSVSGVNGYPFVAPYCMSKHALEGLSESLRRELMLHGIDVIVIGPAVVKTPIWDKARDLDISAYATSAFLPALQTMRNAMQSNAGGLSPEAIGELILRTLTVARPKVRYAISSAPLELLLVRLLPKRLLDRIVAKRLGLLPRIANASKGAILDKAAG
jgi:NAD(P)-dependent dehydrogenase (short-subunit alcohol dehydrogenase family)